jgi:hypothetical protein
VTPLRIGKQHTRFVDAIAMQQRAGRVETDERRELHDRRAGALTSRREPSSTTANSPIASTAKNSKCGLMLEC